MGKEVGIRGYSKYIIDDAGNIYSYRSGSRRKIAQRIHRGYYHVNIKDDNYPARTHKEPVHKLVLSSFVGALLIILFVVFLKSSLLFIAILMMQNKLMHIKY